MAAPGRGLKIPEMADEPVQLKRPRGALGCVFSFPAEISDLLSGAGSSLDQKCAGMSAGSWFHVEYCQPEAAPTQQAWASIPVSEAWPAGDLAVDLPIVAPPMTPVARSLRPQR